MLPCSCLSRFYKKYEKLVARPKQGYSSLPNDLFEFLETLTDKETVRLVHESLRITEVFYAKKCRIKNSGQSLSDKNGFRLIFLYLLKENKFILLEIYPKRGPLQAEDLTEKGLEILISEFLKEREESTLLDVSFEVKKINFTPINHDKIP
jgi:hypothetical protein